MMFHVLIVGIVLCCALATASHADEPVTLARFALIYPDADLSEDDDEKLAPEEAWLRRQAKKPAKSGAQPTATRKGKNATKKRTLPATVTPLRRDRPKNEVAPPKTRRRPLGW